MTDFERRNADGPAVATLDPKHGLFADYRAVWRLLGGRLRLLGFSLLAGTLLGAALEVLGLSLLAALLSAVTPGAQPAGTGFSVLARFFVAGGDAAALHLVALCAVLFTVKNAFMAGLAWAEATFAFRVQAHLADIAVQATLESEYTEATRRTPEQQINLLTSDLYTLVVTLGLPTLTLVSETLLMLGLLGFLVWAEPVLTLAVVVVIGVAAGILIRSSRRAVAALGVRRQDVEDERMRRLRDLFNHLREVYIYRAGAQVARQLRGVTQEWADVHRSFQMLSTGPRFILELLLVGVLLAAIVVGLRAGNSHALIVSVGVFAASGFRLLIGANRLVMSVQGIRFGQSALARLLGATLHRPGEHAALAGIRAAAAPGAGRGRTLSLRGVEFRYSTGSPPVLDGLSIEARRGRMIGIKGGSGSGKTSLLELMAGLRRPTAGAVLLDEQALSDPGSELFRIVGYVAQTTAIFSDTLRRNVAYGYDDDSVDDARVWSALQQAQLADFVRTLPRGLDCPLGGMPSRLSGGQAQRLALARALYADCPFLLLDEPTSALDPLTEAQVVETLAALAADRGVILVSHRPRPLEACDEVYELQHGRLVLVGGKATQASLPVTR